MMTKERQQPKEQIASHTYKRQASSPASRRKTPISGEGSYRAMREMEKGSSPIRGKGHRQTRNVIMPESVHPLAWNRYAQRRDRYQSSRSRSREQEQPKLTARTLAQTGTHAPSGQIRIRPRSLPRSYNVAVPKRSSKQSSTRRAGFLWKVLALFGIVTVLALGSSFALSSSAFRVEQVHIAGTHNAALKQQIQQMGMQGQNIFLINIAALTARIDSLPMVVTASLQKQWPNSLQVTVTERVPVLLWQTTYGTYGVDKQGLRDRTRERDNGRDPVTDRERYEDLPVWEASSSRARTTWRSFERGNYCLRGKRVRHAAQINRDHELYAALHQCRGSDNWAGARESGRIWIVCCRKFSRLASIPRRTGRCQSFEQPADRTIKHSRNGAAATVDIGND